MVLVSSGELSIANINMELGRAASTANTSLDTAENGGYGAINTNSRSYPNASNPAAISEWYGYNHNAVGPGPRLVPMPEVGYANSTSTAQFWLDEACRNSVSRPRLYYGDEERLVGSVSRNQFWTNSGGTIRPPAGYYAQFGTEAVYWNGTTGTSIQACRI